MEGYYSIDELTHKMGAGKRAVYTFLRDKRIKSQRMGTYAYVKKEDVEEWLKAYQQSDIDCVYARAKGCAGLRVGCIPTLCKFKLSKQEAEDSLERSHERLRALSPSLQTYIAKKYYGGKKVWKKP